MSVPVNVDNFVAAETARMFHDLQAQAGGVNLFFHTRAPSPIDNQLVIRLNRDTLYSFGVVDLRGGATLTLPDCGERYLSAMVVNEGHFVQQVLHDAGTHELTEEAVGSRYAVLAVRTLADPENAEDLAEVAKIQDQLLIAAPSSEEYVPLDFDQKSLDDTRTALLTLATGLKGFDKMFGREDETHPVRHLLGAAAGWGGLPTSEASYIGAMPPGDGPFELTMRDVPVDGFWSISVYDAAGYFVPNDRDSYSINNITAVQEDDGSVVVRFGDFGDDVPNVIPTPQGWNFLVRLYRPRTEIHDGTWQLPALVPVS